MGRLTPLFDLVCMALIILFADIAIAKISKIVLNSEGGEHG
jgi:hypothetical protein